MSDTEPDYSDLWAVHSEKEDRPAICDWAPSEAVANDKMAKLRADDEDQAVTYFVTRLTSSEAETYKASGFIPADA